MNTPLAISLRPRTLHDLVGCDKIIQRIRARSDTKRLPKAWMFSGQTGSGKTTIARIIAANLQCTHSVQFGSCRKCYNRRKGYDITELNMPDVKVDELRKILDGSYYNPKPGSKRRVYILDEAHQMSNAAQNLMLKYTEDCPDSTVWITCTTAPDKLLRTLRRRHKIYALPPLELEDVRKIVKLSLKQVHSDLDSGDLVERLLEKNISSPALILNAVENYVEGADIDEATEVEGTSNINTKGLCISVCKGEWGDVSRILFQAKPEDTIAISSSVSGYLKSILLGEDSTSHRAQVAAEAILKLAEVRDNLPAVTACLFKITNRFSRNGS